MSTFMKSSTELETTKSIRVTMTLAWSWAEADLEKAMLAGDADAATDAAGELEFLRDWGEALAQAEAEKAERAARAAADAAAAAERASLVSREAMARAMKQRRVVILQAERAKAAKVTASALNN